MWAHRAEPCLSFDEGDHRRHWSRGVVVHASSEVCVRCTALCLHAQPFPYDPTSHIHAALTHTAALLRAGFFANLG